MIGSGIFIVSHHRPTGGRAGWLLVVWLSPACSTLHGSARSMAVGGHDAEGGGQYVILREAFSHCGVFFTAGPCFSLFKPARTRGCGSVRAS